ncbi:hypothetical protein SHIRM173S_07848 [Streptomyces hirsutus]
MRRGGAGLPGGTRTDSGARSRARPQAVPGLATPSRPRPRTPNPCDPLVPYPMIFLRDDSITCTQCILRSMSTRHVLLGLLASGPSHGYDLSDATTNNSPKPVPWPLPGLHDPATPGPRRPRRGRRHRVGRWSGADRLSRTTEAGERELARWAGEIAPPAPFVTNEIFAKVVVSILSGGDPAAYLRAQRAAHMGRMRELTAVKSAAGAGLATVLSADYALNHLDADLRWITTTAVLRLTTLTAGGRRARATGAKERPERGARREPHGRRHRRSFRQRPRTTAARGPRPGQGARQDARPA